jgi:hypothetical protein
MYKENLENKVRQVGKLINLNNIPDELIQKCVNYVNTIFVLIDQKRPNNDSEYDDLVFSLVDVILLKHLKLCYIAWLKDHTPIDK